MPTTMLARPAHNPTGMPTRLIAALQTCLGEFQRAAAAADTDEGVRRSVSTHKTGLSVPSHKRTLGMYKGSVKP